MSATVAVVEDLEAVIGLEVHCQLETVSKAFCGCSTRFGDAPNTNTCPVCLGLPGALPVFNARALELGLRLAYAMGCTVPPWSVFARKNYFYPDLPKGYQISQYDKPLALGGSLRVDVPGGREMTVRLERIHLEEDAGKSMHEASEDTSFVDLNRAGVPLVEIVSAPDFRSPVEAQAYLLAVRQLVRWLGVSDGNMEQGSLRCDCNVSLRPRGRERLGTKVELKNLNSSRSVVRALEHEIVRQGEVLRAGGDVEHGTRLWDEQSGRTLPMRRKEVAQDYRYFPDPDLPPLQVAPALAARVRTELPELPRARRERFERDMGLPPYDAGVLTASRSVAQFFEEVAAASGDAKASANWVLGEVLRELKERNADLEDDTVAMPLLPSQLAGLMALVASGELSLALGKRVFAALCGTGREASDVASELGLRQVSDEPALRQAVAEVLAQNPKALDDYREGNARTFGFLVGQVMRATGGRANPKLANALLREALEAGDE